MTPWIVLKLEGDGRATFAVTGKADDQVAIRNKLSFHFEIDQTHLPPLIRDLEVLRAEFPVIGEEPWEAARDPTGPQTNQLWMSIPVGIDIRLVRFAGRFAGLGPNVRHCAGQPGLIGGGEMASVEVKNVSAPDETRPFASHGQAAVVNVGDHPVLYGTFEPGWKWSEHIKPIAGTDKCEATHLLYCTSGRMRIAMTDGSEAEIGPGDVASISPGHDAWVVGDEPCVAVDFGGYARYAQK